MHADLLPLVLQAPLLWLYAILIPDVGLRYRIRGGLDPVYGWPKGTVAARLLFVVPFGALMGLATTMAGLWSSPWIAAASPVLLACSTYMSLWIPHEPFQDMGLMHGNRTRDILGMSLLVGLPRHCIILLPLTIDILLSGREVDASTAAAVCTFAAFGLLHGPAYALGYRTQCINHPEIARGPEASEVFVGMVHQAALTSAFAVLVVGRALA